MKLCEKACPSAFDNWTLQNKIKKETWLIKVKEYLFEEANKCKSAPLS
jgi:hypothetical protein